MARGRNSNSGTGSGVDHFASNAINKEDEYKQGLKRLQARAKLTAELITEGGALETLLKEADSDNADSFLLSQRNRLKAIAEGNAKQKNEIDYFLLALKDVRADVQQRRNQSNAAAAAAAGGDDTTTADNNEDEAPDYERFIQEAVERIREAKESDPNYAPLEDQDYVIELRQTLGEKMKKRSRNDDDDDLEIVDNVGVDDVHKLKCPITGMLFQDPVKNKVCGHVYDQMGFNQLMRNGKKKCPVPGCSNHALKKEQLEPDEEMKLKVRRHKMREEAAKKKRDLDESMDDQGGGYTVLE